MYNKLTIITTLVNSNSINRIIQIERFVKYHSRMDLRIIIVCPDDVEIPTLKANHLEIINCDHRLNVTEKVLLALKYVKTPYVSWIADDDFLGYDFAKKSISELDKHDYIAGCDGFMFFIEEGTLKRQDIKYSYNSFKKGLKANIDGHKGKRFRFQADYYHPGITHSVIRKDVIITALQFILDYKIPVNFADRIFVAIVMIYGDIKYVNSITNIRSFGTRIMHHNPSLFNKAEIGPRELIMHENIVKEVFNQYEKNHGNLTPGIKSDILYFLMKSSKAFNDYTDKTTIKYKLKQLYILICSYLEPTKLSLLNKEIRNDIKLVKKFMKEYSLKGN